MGKVKINWFEAYQEFLATDGMSLRDVAEKYGVSYSRVKKVSMARKWTIAKNRVWEAARESAINETMDSAKELIIRHSKIARYFQETGVRLLKKRLKDKKTALSDALCLRMLVLGLKTERELYPQNLIIKESEKSVEKNRGFSKALDEAIYEVFKKKIIRKKPSRDKSPKLALSAA